MKRPFLIFTLILGYGSWTYCVEQTAVIAAKMRYPAAISKLRNRTDNWLRKYRISMSDTIQNLRSHDFDLRAEVVTVNLKDTYFELEKKIDTVFEELNRQFIAGAQRLDLEDASLKTKKAFVVSMIKKSVQKIDELRKKESAYFAK